MAQKTLVIYNNGARNGLEYNLNLVFYKTNFTKSKITTMTLVKTNYPFAKSFDGLLSDLFNDFPATLGKTVKEGFRGFPAVNITELNNIYNLQLAAPGFDKADFTLNVEGEILTISAEKKTGSKVENEKVIRTEFSTENFKRSFTVDEKINAAGISAKYENGILFVELPKKEVVNAVAKQITIQ